MTLTLGEVLELDALRRARPEMLHGDHLLGRPVRWVHTSELAEAAFLLKGGELLLTTGQGLFGRGAVGETAFVEALAERGVTALALELGWTYTEAPEALVAAARRTEVALLVLHEIVPFVEMTEQVQTALLERAAATVRRDRTLRERLTDTLLVGGGPAELVAELTAHVGAPVVVVTRDGMQVAGAQQEAGRRLRPVCRRDVRLLDQLWGQVQVLPPGSPDDPAVAAACTAGADAMSLALLRSATADDLAARRRRLVQELVDGRPAGEIRATAAALGVPLAVDGRYVTVLVRGVLREDVATVLGAVERSLWPATAIVGDLGTELVGLAAASAVDGAAVLAAVDHVPGARGARVVVGPMVTGLAEVGRAVAEARRVLDRAVGMGMPDRWLSADALSAQILLGELVGRPAAQRLVVDEIGPLLEHDRRTSARLVETLRVYLAHGSSKVDAAATLRIRRQTMHQRLARITQLVGDVQAPARHTNLVLALALAALGQEAGESAGAKPGPLTEPREPFPVSSVAMPKAAT
ncbi:MAG: PucR family transcriptional regulator [Pseudonocardia sp.]